MKVELENVKPMDIEKRSFQIITEELGDTPLTPGTELVVSIQVRILIMPEISVFLQTQWKKPWKPSNREPVL